MNNESGGNHKMANKTNIAMVTVIGILIAAYFAIDFKQQARFPPPFIAHSKPYAEVSTQAKHAEPYVDLQLSNLKMHADDKKKKKAFQQRISDLQVHSAGQVQAVLPDDQQGSAHQKFILKLSTQQTVLVAHNIDLSARLQNLKQGDTVEFYGEYEYSPQGGVIHWTHHDPQKKHVDGWLKYNGQIYQ